jgi:hypothetical protein
MGIAIFNVFSYPVRRVQQVEKDQSLLQCKCSSVTHAATSAQQVEEEDCQQECVTIKRLAFADMLSKDVIFDRNIHL